MYRDNNRDNRDNGRPTGNSQERLEIHSGWVLMVDQFMLGNAQFLAKVREAREGASDFQGREPALALAVKAYGGCLLPLPYGTYQVQRSPEQNYMFIAPRGEGSVDETSAAVSAAWKRRAELSCRGEVFIDTRCVVFVDMELLLDDNTLREYTKLRQRGDDKQARDMLREYGATVRYGFNPRGDELGIFEIESPKGLALWPDVIESLATPEGSDDQGAMGNF